MKKFFLLLIFSNSIFSELTLEITEGTEDPYRVAILPFKGDKKLSTELENIIINNLRRSGCLLYTSPSPRDR